MDPDISAIQFMLTSYLNLSSNKMSRKAVTHYTNKVRHMLKNLSVPQLMDKHRILGMMGPKAQIEIPPTARCHTSL